MDAATRQPSDDPLRVVIVDDQPIFRDAARNLLAARGYHVVAEAGCAAGALDAVEEHAPHAVLLDVRLGGDDGFAVCGTLTRRRPELAILLASDTDCDDYHQRAERCGARGYVPKSRLHATDLGQFFPRR